MPRTTRWVLLVPVLISACGGGSGGASVPLADYLAQLPAAQCAMAVACGEVAAQATCEAWTTDQSPSITAEVASGKRRYDGEAAAACLEQYARANCTATARAVPSPCSKVLQGNVAPGGACTTSRQCADGLCDTLDVCAGIMCCVGTCMARPPEKAIGATCQGSDRCAGDGYCATSATGQGTCRARLSVGAKCEQGQLCAGGSVCLAGLCRLPVPRGASCDNTFCDDIENDFCDGATKTCIPRVAVGANCASDTSDTCVRYATCDIAAGKCVAMGALGSPCFNGLPCQPLLECREAVCAKAAQAPACP
jgi:hypothetical protein